LVGFRYPGRGLEVLWGRVAGCDAALLKVVLVVFFCIVKLRSGGDLGDDGGVEAAGLLKSLL